MKTQEELKEIMKNEIAREVATDYDVRRYANRVAGDIFHDLLENSEVVEAEIDDYTKTLVDLYTMFVVNYEMSGSRCDYMSARAVYGLRNYRIKLKDDKAEEILKTIKKGINRNAIAKIRELLRFNEFVEVEHGIEAYIKK